MEPVDEKDLSKQLKETSQELRQLKSSLGIDKVTRDKVKGEDSISAYLENLKIRARQFGIVREKQLDKALELFNELAAKITLHDNCLSGDTEVITYGGVRPIGSLAGSSPTLLMRDGSWRQASVRQFGEQELFEITFRRGRTTKVLRATENHRWFARKAPGRQLREVSTSDLVGLGVPSINACRRNVEPSPWGIAHGITFGDGSRDATQPGSPAKVVLCGEKDAELLKWFPHSPTRVVPGVGIEVGGLPRSWKDAPSLDLDSAYLHGWLLGYLAADGTVGTHGDIALYSAKRENLVVARDVCYRLGIPTLGISTTSRLGFGGRSDLHRLRFPVGAIAADYLLLASHRLNACDRRSGRQVLGDWRAVEVRATGQVEPVYCAQVEGLKSFVLADNMLTGNCTEDERREFHINESDIVSWIRDVADPSYMGIDEHFRTHEQSLLPDCGTAGTGPDLDVRIEAGCSAGR